jgi:hypothetical protein
VNHNNHQASNSTTNHVRTVADANDFLQRMKGKGPRESLGNSAPSSLGWAFLQATVGCFVLMAALTVGPYYLWGKGSGADEKTAAKATEKTDKQESVKNETKTPETPKATEKTGDKSGTTTADSKKDKAVPSKDIVDKLKENETKTGTPKDPFGTNIDDLIDKK